MKKNEVYSAIKILKRNKDVEISIIEINGNKFLLKKVISDDKKIINMLKNEANNLQLLKGTNVTPRLFLYEFERENYIIMELIAGVTINKLINISFKEKVLLVLKIIDALKKIHHAGIIHCDLKPSNIMLDESNEIKIIDFGISSRNSLNCFREYGSIEYCSKNQILGLKTNKIIDLYAIGIIFYELVIGKNPFGNNKSEIIYRKKNDNYYITDNDLLNLIFNKLFDSKFERKYKSLEEFESDLKLLLQFK